MKLGSFYHQSLEKNIYGIIEDSVLLETDSLYQSKTGGEFDLSGEEMKINTPVKPGKIIAVGLNYNDHIVEMKHQNIPEDPVLFLKPPSAVIPHLGSIVRPKVSARVDYEAELAVVISKEIRHVTESEALKSVLGFTAFNDVTARDLQKKDGQWTRAKGFDTFAPFGPYIETELDFENLKIQSILNQEVRQSSNTSKMIFSIPFLISYISGIMTLYPGDVISTGTPQGIGPMESGDEIIISVEGLEVLKNFVR